MATVLGVLLALRRSPLPSDLDAVSRASLTINSATRAIRGGSRMMARAFLDPAAVRRR